MSTRRELYLGGHSYNWHHGQEITRSSKEEGLRRKEHTHIVATTNKLIYKRDLTNWGVCDNEKNQQEGKLIEGTRNY